MTRAADQGDPGFARLPEPPYWAVVFSSRRRGGGEPEDDSAYQAAAARMEQLAAGRPGYLGLESARDGAGFGITVSYWSSPEAIRGWRRDAEHTLVRELGRLRWYSHYELRVARVERAYGWHLPASPGTASGQLSGDTPACRPEI